MLLNINPGKVTKKLEKDSWQPKILKLKGNFKKRRTQPKDQPIPLTSKVKGVKLVISQSHGFPLF